jgi:hypothetical protein
MPLPRPAAGNSASAGGCHDSGKEGVMAVTSLWPVHGAVSRVVDYTENPEKTTVPVRADESEQGFFNVLEYAENADKTARRLFVTGLNCMPETAAEQMLMTKQRYGKTGGTVAFHGYQSFRYQEASPELAHQIGVETAKRIWGDRFEVVVSTHLNTNSVHNHFVINSVSFADGKRLNDNKALKRKIREVSDELCREHGLSVIEQQSPTKTPRNLWLAEHQGQDTRYNVMRRDINDSVKRAFTPKFLYAELRRMGYLIQYDDKWKYATIQIPGTARPTRFKTLGPEYTQERLEERVMENNQPSQTYYSPEKPRRYNFAAFSLRGLYAHYCYVLGVVRDNNRHPYYSAALRADIRRLEDYSHQAQMLSAHGIDTTEQLQAFLDTAKSEIAYLTKKRSRVYQQISRCTDETALPSLLEKRSALTDKISALRKDVKNGNAVMDRSQEIEEKVRATQEREKQKRSTQR